jgi:phosphate transport system permease protein
LRGCAVVSGAIVVLVIVFLIVESVPALRAIGVRRMLAEDGWHPADASAQFGLAPMLYGTLFATAGAIVIAAPAGVLSAVFARFYAPRAVAALYRRVLELLAGVPSVVYGLWGLVVLVPLIRRLEPPGPSLLAGILILALMILPTVALLADAALGAVPAAHLRGAAALGMARWATIRRVALPGARAGILTGVLLATGRALGETMAVLMVCGNLVQTPTSVFDPIRTLTANIALEMGYAVGDHRSALFATGLGLMLLIVGLVLLVAVVQRVGGGGRHA